jgi:hypothetical protein
LGKLKVIGTTAMLLMLSHTWANDLVLYDAINGQQLEFISASRYEELAIDELNKFYKVGYSFFVFANEDYERQRLDKLYEYFKTYAALEHIGQQLTVEAKQHHEAEMRKRGFTNSSVIQQRYKGYAVGEVEIRPIGFLGNTLTFIYSMDYYLLEGFDEYYDFNQIFILNLDDFSFMPVQQSNDCISKRKLRKALIKKWQSVTRLMPNRNWELMTQKHPEQERDDFYLDEVETENKLPSFYGDSLIGYALREADLSQAVVYWNGAGVMVRLENAIPWFASEEPLHVQLHLDPWEAKKAFEDCAAFATLAKARNDKGEAWTVDPFYELDNAFYLRLDRQFLNFEKVDDPDITAVECIYKDHPTDSQYLFRVDYLKGRAQLISKGDGKYAPYYDSIFWKDDHVLASILHEETYSETGRPYRRSLRLQKRNENGNTLWYLNTKSQFDMHAFTFFSDRVARFNYSILTSKTIQNLDQKTPNWYIRTADGFCVERWGCVSLDEEGRISQRYTNTYAYQDGKLLQILGDRDKYTLFFYDDQGRLEEVTDQISGQKELHYYYEEDATIPHRVEKIDDRSRNTYYRVLRE